VKKGNYSHYWLTIRFAGIKRMFSSCAHYFQAVFNYAHPERTAASPAAAATDAPKPGGILKIADVVFPSNLSYTADPAFARGGHALNLFFDTILKGDINGKISPNLASSWTVAPDKSSITLNLLKGVKFHDGSDWMPRQPSGILTSLLLAKFTIMSTSHQ